MKVSETIRNLLSKEVFTLLFFTLLAGGGAFSPLHAAEAGSIKREIALLDLAGNNNDFDYSTFALKQALEVAGIPYVVTTSVDEAVTYAMIATSSYMSFSTLGAAPTGRINKDKLIAYVSNGGILVSTDVYDGYLLPRLFGITSQVVNRARRAMTWQTAGLDPTLSYFDDPNEQTISLGGSTPAAVIPTRGYTLSSAVSLARFDDGSDAVTRNDVGAGKAYALGFSYAELILRNQLDLDYNAQRSTYDGFEPTSDTVMLFLRQVYESNVPFAAWRYTAPDRARSALMLTHDVHPTLKSADLAVAFADFEFSRGITAQYTVQTNYLPDSNGDSYTPYIGRYQTVVGRNQKIGSHTVGHFKDWANETTFPLGAPGNTPANYTPSYNGSVTTGGTVYGEIEVPRNLLETDLGVTVKTFRSGSLYWNDRQVNVLDALGYRYDSSNSANDVLTNFPYLLKYDRTFAGAVSPVYEIPMTLWDLGLNTGNYQARVTNWLSVIERNAANFAPTVLLIHPHIEAGLPALTSLLDQLPAGIATVDMDSFGDFWRQRNDFEFQTSLSGDVLTITVLDETPFPVQAGFSLFLKNGANLSDIVVQKEDGTPLDFLSADGGDSSLFLYGFSDESGTPGEPILLPVTVHDAGVNGATASNIVDVVAGGQDLATFWKNNGVATTAWFTLDLAAQATVTQLNLAPSRNRSHKLTITIGDALADGKASGTAAGVCNSANLGITVPTALETCLVNGVGRYVTVQGDRPWLQFHGIEVWGTSSEPDLPP